MAFLLICSKVDSPTASEYVRLDLSPELEAKFPSLPAERLYRLVSEKLGLAYGTEAESKATFELLCFGRCLKPEKTLASYGVTTGTTVFVIKARDLGSLSLSARKEKEEKDKIQEKKGKESKRLKLEDDVQKLVFALKTALMRPEFRETFLDKLKEEKEMRENLVAVTPGLREDPVAFAILQDPDLLALLLADPEVVNKTLEKHPALRESVTQLTAAFHEEVATPGLVGGNMATHSAYDMNADLDEDEDEDMETSGGQSRTPRSQQTMAQMLNQAIINANRSLAQRSAAGRQTSTGASTSAASQPPAGFITPEMLRQALSGTGSSSATLPSGSTPAPTPVSTPTSTSAPTSAATAPATISTPTSAPVTVPGQSQAPARDWSQQLQQMKAMGLSDERVCIQALEAMNGNVEQAINFIFSDSSNN